LTDAVKNLPCKRKYIRSKNFVHQRSLNQFDIHTNAVIVRISQLPGTLAHQRHQTNQGVDLVNPQAVDIAPESGGHRQAGQLEKSAQHGVKSQIAEVPDPVKADEQLHQKSHCHLIVAQLGFARRSL
jgi:hypothetical protein